jgi:GrpB-like predicted nucleotidyltransferase (UPF0157 family)
MTGDSEPATVPGFQAEAAVYRSRHHYRASEGVRQPEGQIHADRLMITDYDPRWPLLFRLERQRMRARLGGSAVSIEHVGSSSVPNLEGRPEIDILIGTRTSDDVNTCADLLTSLGYVTTAHPPSPSDGWRLMAKPSPIPFEVLIVQHLSPLWRRVMALRDYLRRHPAKALAYGQLKAKWAAKSGADTEAYKEAKRRFWGSV